MTDQLLPDRLNGMDTAPGTTDAERAAVRDAVEDYIQRMQIAPDLQIAAHIRNGVAAAMRAVASRTRPATPAPAPDAEALAVIEMCLVTWQCLGIKEHVWESHGRSGGLPAFRCTRCATIWSQARIESNASASAFIVRHTGEK